MSDESAPSRMLSYPEGADSIDRQFVDAFTRIPDGSYVEGIITVVSFTTTEGLHRWMVHTNADVPATMCVGLLNSAAVQLMATTEGMITGVSPPLDDD